MMLFKQNVPHIDMNHASLRILLKAVENYWENFLGLNVFLFEKTQERGSASSSRMGRLGGCSVKLPSMVWRTLTLWSGCLKTPRKRSLWADRLSWKESIMLRAGTCKRAWGGVWRQKKIRHMEVAFSKVPAGAVGVSPCACWQPCSLRKALLSNMSNWWIVCNMQMWMHKSPEWQLNLCEPLRMWD